MNQLCEKTLTLKTTVFSLPHALAGKTFRSAGKNLLSPKDTSRMSYLSEDGVCLTVWRHTHAHTHLSAEDYSRQFLGTSLVLLCHGGYLAGGVFEGERCVAHKTAHRYVVRRKQGKRQMNFDKHGGSGRSTGSQIRRWNEEKHRDDVTSLLSEWKEYLDRANWIFLHTPGENRKLFFPKDGPSLLPHEHRVLSIAMSSSRPKFSEVTRVWSELCSLSVSEIDPKDVRGYLDHLDESLPVDQSVPLFDPLDDTRARQIVYPKPREMMRGRGMRVMEQEMGKKEEEEEEEEEGESGELEGDGVAVKS